jgi:hypothetical protein
MERVCEASSTENRRSQSRRMISCDRDMPAKRALEEVKASVETENLSIGVKELGVRRKEGQRRNLGE